MATPAKKAWTKPVIQTIDLKAAAGAHPGTNCDKYGSLSHTSGGRQC